MHPKLRSQLAVRKQSDHRQHDRGQEAQDGNGLQDIQKRNHESFRPGIVGGNIPISHGEAQAEKVRSCDPYQRKEGILRQGGRGKLDFCSGIDGADSVMRKGDQAIEQRKSSQQDRQVAQKGGNRGGENSPRWNSRRGFRW